MTQRSGTALVLEAPRFSLDELRKMRSTYGMTLHYVGPVGLNETSTRLWREHKEWLDRLDSLIAETEEWEAGCG